MNSCGYNQSKIKSTGVNKFEVQKVPLIASNSSVNSTKQKNQKRGNPDVVECFNSDGSLVKVFSSGAEAAKYLNVSREDISRCCRGEKMSVGGFTFKFKQIKFLSVEVAVMNDGSNNGNSKHSQNNNCNSDSATKLSFTSTDSTHTPAHSPNDKLKLCGIHAETEHRFNSHFDYLLQTIVIEVGNIRNKMSIIATIFNARSGVQPPLLRDKVMRRVYDKGYHRLTNKCTPISSDEHEKMYIQDRQQLKDEFQCDSIVRLASSSEVGTRSCLKAPRSTSLQSATSNILCDSGRSLFPVTPTRQNSLNSVDMPRLSRHLNPKAMRNIAFSTSSEVASVRSYMPDPEPENDWWAKDKEWRQRDEDIDHLASMFNELGLEGFSTELCDEALRSHQKVSNVVSTECVVKLNHDIAEKAVEIADGETAGDLQIRVEQSLLFMEQHIESFDVTCLKHYREAIELLPCILMRGVEQSSLNAASKRRMVNRQLRYVDGTVERLRTVVERLVEQHEQCELLTDHLAAWEDGDLNRSRTLTDAAFNAMEAFDIETAELQVVDSPTRNISGQSRSSVAPLTPYGLRAQHTETVVLKRLYADGRQSVDGTQWGAAHTEGLFAKHIARCTNLANDEQVAHYMKKCPPYSAQLANVEHQAVLLDKLRRKQYTDVELFGETRSVDEQDVVQMKSQIEKVFKKAFYRLNEQIRLVNQFDKDRFDSHPTYATHRLALWTCLREIRGRLGTQLRIANKMLSDVMRKLNVGCGEDKNEDDMSDKDGGGGCDDTTPQKGRAVSQHEQANTLKNVVHSSPVAERVTSKLRSALIARGK